LNGIIDCEPVGAQGDLNLRPSFDWHVERLRAFEFRRRVHGGCEETRACGLFRQMQKHLDEHRPAGRRGWRTENGALDNILDAPRKRLACGR
jgi:hypothetical protein